MIDKENIWEHVMVDIETLGRTPGAIITEIAIVPFNWDNKNENAKDSFYRKISLESSVKAGLKIDTNTLVWWSEQNPEVYKKMMDQTNTIPLDQALFELKVYLDSLHPSTLQLWGNSNRFDLGILAYTYELLGRQLPWLFRNERDVRTLVSLYPEIKANHIFEGNLHNPIDDCINQIDYVVETKNRLKKII